MIGAGCTQSEVLYFTGAISNWNFGSSATPQTAAGVQSVNTEYGSTGRYDLSVNAYTFEGFTHVCTSSYQIIQDILVQNETCDMANGTAEVQVLGDTSLFYYAWQPTNDTSALINGLTAGIYSVVVRDSNNCLDSSSVTVLNTEGPTVELDFDIGCFGEPTAITIDTTGAVVNCTYDFGDGGNSTICGTNSHLYNAQGTYYASIIVSDVNGCADTALDTVIINPKPAGTIIVDPRNGCEPLLVNFITDIVDTINNAFLWQSDDGNSGSNATFSNVYNQGTYFPSVTVTNQFGCDTTIVVNSSIQVSPTPLADFSYSPTELDAYNSTVNFIDESSGNVVLYYWDLGDSNTTSVSRDISHTYTDTGSYVVMHVVGNSALCYDTVYQIVRVNEVFSFFVPNAFTPDENGVNEAFQWVSTGVSPNDFEFIIFNRWGEEVFRTNLVDGFWDGKKDGEYVPSGIYPYRVQLRDNFNKKKYYYGHVGIYR